MPTPAATQTARSTTCQPPSPHLLLPSLLPRTRAARRPPHACESAASWPARLMTRPPRGSPRGCPPPLSSPAIDQSATWSGWPTRSPSSKAQCPSEFQRPGCPDPPARVPRQDCHSSMQRGHKAVFFLNAHTHLRVGTKYQLSMAVWNTLKTEFPSDRFGAHKAIVQQCAAIVSISLRDSLPGAGNSMRLDRELCFIFLSF